MGQFDQKVALVTGADSGMGLPGEIAGLALYLASDPAAYVTGSTFFIDGGLMRHTGGL